MTVLQDMTVLQKFNDKSHRMVTQYDTFVASLLHKMRF